MVLLVNMLEKAFYRAKHVLFPKNGVSPSPPPYWPCLFNGHQSKCSILQSTPALRTPRYYGHPAITDSSKIPGESYRRLTEINSRYYGLSLLRTYGHFIRSQRHNFTVFSLVIADTEQRLGIFAHISSVFFLLFETVFVFFGRFPLLLSISQNSLIFFS